MKPYPRLVTIALRQWLIPAFHPKSCLGVSEPCRQLNGGSVCANPEGVESPHELLIIVILVGLALIDRNHPTDTDAIVEVVEPMAFVIVTHDMGLAVFIVENPEVVVSE